MKKLWWHSHSHWSPNLRRINAMLTALVETILKSSLKGIVVIMITVENCPYVSSYYAIIDFHIRKFV